MQIVGKRTTDRSSEGAAFGDRLRQIRKTHGLTQTQLGERMGISQRLVAYYEAEGGSPSPDLVVRFAEALDVHPNLLLGVDKPRRAAEINPKSVRMWRRFQRLEQLPEHDRKTVFKMIDALADRRKRTG